MKMNYQDYTDEELISLCNKNDAKMTEYLLTKYEGMISKKANSMYIIGGDVDDLCQEGRIGLHEAIQSYDASKGASFHTFAEVCVSRQMYSAIEKAERIKHAPLNSYKSIYDEDFLKEGGVNPEEDFLDKERVVVIEKALEKVLSEFEKKVLDLKLTGMNYVEIAAVLGKDSKSTDNAISRIKSKLKKVLESN